MALPSLQGGYPAMLNASASVYGDILSGYQQTLSNQQAAQQPISQGYGALENQVMGTIQGIDASQRQQIADMYAQQTGSGLQSLVNAGLGNTTVTSAVQRGLVLDKAKADVALSNQTAQLMAGYQSQLGLAGLAYRGQAVQQNTDLMRQQYGFMGQYAQALLAHPGQYGQQPGGFGGFGGSSGIGGPQGGGGGSPYGVSQGQYIPQYGQYDPYIDWNDPNAGGAPASGTGGGFAAYGGGGTWDYTKGDSQEQMGPFQTQDIAVDPGLGGYGGGGDF